MKIAVMGAGHGGKAMAAHLGLMGHEVRLYNYKEKEPEFKVDLEEVRRKGGIELEGAVEGFGPIALATTDAGEAVRGADLIMVVVPAHAHKYIARSVAPHLQPGQEILLNPGRTFGAIEFKRILGERAEGVIVGEAETLVYAARGLSPTRVKVLGVKKEVKLAALPAPDTGELLDTIRQLYPQFDGARDVLETSLTNIGAVFHPTITLMNAGWIERGGDFEFYVEGASPSVSKVLERVDAERVALARALDTHVLNLLEWLEEKYGARGRDVYEALQNNEAYRGIKAPSTLAVRYLLEDVPTGLVPYADVGEQVGVSTPVSKSLISIASAVFDRDFYAEGRSAKNLGLEGMSAEEIVAFVRGE